MGFCDLIPTSFTSAAAAPALAPSQHRFCAFSNSSGQYTPVSVLSVKSRRSLVIVARAGPSHCEPSSSSGYSGLNGPLEVKSANGLFLRGVFLNQRDVFDAAVADELTNLAEERDDAVSRLVLCSRPDEVVLHRRITLMKEHECRQAVEDVMYLLIFSKFSDIHVPLVPRLSRCIYNGRLEILPSKDWELESIHNMDVLELIKEHIFATTGLRINSGVTEHWATTEILKRKLSKIYAGTLLYGYFLRSATSRHHLERCLAKGKQKTFESGDSPNMHLSDSVHLRLPNLVFNRMVAEVVFTAQGAEDCGNFRGYVLGFDLESLLRCSKVKSREAANLVQKHSLALFWDEVNNTIESDEKIVTSFGSLKRLILEAFAFGSFLWDAEEYVSSFFRLEEA